MIRPLLRGGQPLILDSHAPSTWIVGYHLVEGATGLSIDMPKAVFLEHLRLLTETAEIVSLLELKRQLQARGPAPPKTQVVLTFDDAFLNFYEVIAPLLDDSGLPATLFVPPGFINGDGNHPLYHARFRHMRPMTWEQVRECAYAGIEIGSHTYQHTNLVRLSRDAVAVELSRSQQEIERYVGLRPTCVCYPEGFTNRAVVDIASRFYSCGVVGGGRAIREASPRGMLRLPRLPMRADMPVDDLSRVLKQPVCLEEWAADKVRRLRGRIARRDYPGGVPADTGV
ncbi:MAG: polysaccharide deacetylase family protein [Thermoleophilia bacterium]|nr:polysaccharide deacetylase family protein [Thermoleophilia bacterium]